MCLHLHNFILHTKGEPNDFTSNVLTLIKPHHEKCFTENKIRFISFLFVVIVSSLFWFAFIRFVFTLDYFIRSRRQQKKQTTIILPTMDFVPFIFFSVAFIQLSRQRWKFSGVHFGFYQFDMSFNELPNENLNGEWKKKYNNYCKKCLFSFFLFV